MSDRRKPGLYAITDSDLIPAERLVRTVEEAILGGARMIQYRDKSADRTRRLAEAGSLVVLCRGHGLPLIVNDDVELAAEVGAAGVHLGKDDPAIACARARLGEQAIIGVSCYDRLDRARDAAAAGANYVAFGSFFPSPTKPAAARPDVRLLREARQALTLPIVAIGGITPGNGRRLVEAGADYLAVISGVFGADATQVRAAAAAYAALYGP